jgi:hypothetical protein
MLALPHYNAYEGQSLYDIAILTYGDASKAISIAAHNGISVTTKLVAGQKIALQDAEKNIQVLQVYSNTGVIPATSFDDANAALSTGIGFMDVGTTFKVT